MRIVVAAVMLLAGFAASPVLGQFVPAGPELRVNPDNADVLATNQAIAGAATGEFVVVWDRVNDDVSYGVRARRYDNAGVPQGLDFEVPTSLTHTSDRTAPAVGSDPSGTFVVVWGDQDADVVEARRFDRDGTPLGADFTLNENPVEYPNHPRVAVHPDGHFVVVWLGGPPGLDFPKVVGRLFDGTGTPLGGEFTVSGPVDGNPYYVHPDVAVAGDGTFTVVWAESQSLDDRIFGRRFDPGGAPLGAEFVVNPSPSHDGDQPAVAAAPDGRVVVVWRGAGISGQRYDAGGAPLGGEFQVSVTHPQFGDVEFPAVAAGPDGSFVVAWSHGGDTVHGRRFHADGTPDGGEVTLNTTPAELYEPGIGVVVDAEGDFVVTWLAPDDDQIIFDDLTDVMARRFSLPCGTGTVNGTEACDDGNTTAGDGCDPGCQIEPCFTCSGEPSVCTPIPFCSGGCQPMNAEKTTLVIKRLLPPAGDEVMSLRGRVASLLSGDGARVVVEGSGGPIFALTVPVAGTPCGPRDGWTLRPLLGGGNAYKNKTNALPPGARRAPPPACAATGSSTCRARSASWRR